MPAIDSNLLTAIIAATAALFGAAVGQLGPLVQHWLSGRRERKALLRERYEEMASLVTQLMSLLDKRMEVRKSGQHVGASSVGAAGIQMHTLALLYFPEFLQAVKELHNAALAFEAELDAPKSPEALDAALAPFVSARDTINDLLQQRASRYT